MHPVHDNDGIPTTHPAPCHATLRSYDSTQSVGLLSNHLETPKGWPKTNLEIRPLSRHYVRGSCVLPGAWGRGGGVCCGARRTAVAALVMCVASCGGFAKSELRPEAFMFVHTTHDCSEDTCEKFAGGCPSRWPGDLAKVSIANPRAATSSPQHSHHDHSQAAWFRNHFFLFAAETKREDNRTTNRKPTFPGVARLACPVVRATAKARPARPAVAPIKFE